MGIPFAVQKTTALVPIRDCLDAVNQHATYLNVQLDSGLAPMEWQSNVGPVVVYRTDGQDMRVKDVDKAVNIVCRLIGMFECGTVQDASHAKICIETWA